MEEQSFVEVVLYGPLRRFPQICVFDQICLPGGLELGTPLAIARIASANCRILASVRDYRVMAHRRHPGEPGYIVHEVHCLRPWSCRGLANDYKQALGLPTSLDEGEDF